MGDLCPRCGKSFDKRRAALSRIDNKTEICPDCGVVEAIGPELAAEVRRLREASEKKVGD